MQVQLTNAGAALLDANTGPITLTAGKLGSAFNYTPQATDIDIHGAAVFTTVPTAPVAVNANIVRYSLAIDYTAGPFDFGEVGLYTQNGTLFALGAASTTTHKSALTSSSVGNSLRIDIYLSMVSQNYEMWLDLAESNNEFRCAVLGSPDQLPPPQAATPNMYIISGESQYQAAFIAYTDRQGLWNFDAYDYANQATATITSFDNKSVTIALSDYTADMNPGFLGQVILEYTTGANFGTCRYINTAVTSGNFVTLGFVNTVQTLPIVGDKIVVYARRALTVDQALPIATSVILGGIKVGNSLSITSDGILDVNYGAIPYPVTSVAGRTGAVVLTYTDIGGLATVAHTGNYNDLINTPTPYSLPIASLSTLGGVKAPPSGNLTINSSGVIDIGFSAVTSVAGRSGIVTLTYTDIGGLATVAHTGDYNDLINKPVIPAAYVLPIASATVLGGIKIGSGLSIDGTGVVTVTGGYTLPPATSGVLGGVKIGANVTVQVDGTISVAAPYSLPIASSGVLGGVKVGSGLAIDGSGVLSASYSLPIASASVLGGIKVGAGLTIDGTGVLSANVTSVPVTSVSGQTGAVVISAADTSAASGTTLITDAGNTTGTIKIRRLVAGTNVTLAADGNNNLVISATATAPVTSVSGQTGAVVVQASDTSTASGTTLISDSGSTTANIKIRRIVAGSGIALALDGNSNLQISTSGGVTTFNTRSGAVTLQASDISGASGALLTDVAAAKYYDVQGGSAGVLTASQLICQHVCARALNFSANFAGSQGYAGTAPTASATFIVNKIHSGSSTQIGTIVFSASSQTATFTTTGGAAQTTVAGDVIQITAPSSADTTLANVSVTLLTLAT